MKKLFLTFIQYFAFKAYKYLDKVGVFNVLFLDNLFIKIYFVYKNKIENIDLSFLEAHLKSNSIVIDVGANTGYFIVKVCKYLNKNAKIIAIEPDKKNAIRLEKVISKFKLVPETIVYNCAASNFNGEGFLMRDFGNPANHQVSITNQSGVSTTFLTLDKISMNLERVDLIKIDVQGHEFEVLQGGRNLILQFNPLIIIEIDNKNSHLQTKKIWDFLLCANYQIYFGDSGKKITSFNDILLRKGYFDCICLHNNLNS